MSTQKQKEASARRLAITIADLARESGMTTKRLRELVAQEAKRLREEEKAAKAQKAQKPPGRPPKPNFCMHKEGAVSMTAAQSMADDETRAAESGNHEKCLDTLRPCIRKLDPEKPIR
jgi:hypothetical protein